MSKKILFIVLMVALYSFVFLNSYVLVSENLYFNSLGDQLTYEQIENLLAQGKKWEWLGYAILPVVYVIKLSLVAVCLGVGMLFVNRQFTFKKMFGVALVAEFVFLVPAFLKILWFTFVQTDYDLKDLQLFYPLSALHFFDYKTLETWWVYPLQTFNVFEIIYWLLLARGIQEAPLPPEGELKTIKTIDFEQSLGLVMSSYGIGLVLWIATVMFISVSYSV
ncbi:MAG: hypothetical protein EAZ50_08415 [Runella slithyformis]|nr:MAG: hypothetical protein EAZ50_08415 [Runella slithyformis]